MRSPSEKFRPALETRFPGVMIEAAAVGFLRHSPNRALMFAVIPAFLCVILADVAGVTDWIKFGGLGLIMGIAFAFGARLWQRWIVVMPGRIVIMRTGWWSVGPRAIEREYPRPGVWIEDGDTEALGWRRLVIHGLETTPMPVRFNRPSRGDLATLLAALPVPARPDATAP